MNELATVRPAGADIEAYRASTDAATMCKEIVLKTSSRIQGKDYVSVEGWQAIAVAHGCAAGARDVERVDGGVRAVGEIRRMSDGQLIAVAEGFVGEDETTWFGGKDKRGKVHDKRPDYAIRAMAQTRAISRACRSAFAHVVVMMNAGLATTPAEEMIAFDTVTGEVIETPPEREPVRGIHAIKQRLRKLQTEGGAATDLEAFNALVTAHKDDLTTIKEAGHEWWTGDGEDFEGFRSFIKRRREELSKEPSLQFQLLVSTLKECETGKQLQAWLGQHGEVVETLDGAEGREFQEIYETTESALKALDNVGAG